jgi:hypothetical protein
LKVDANRYDEFECIADEIAKHRGRADLVSMLSYDGDDVKITPEAQHLRDYDPGAVYVFCPGASSTRLVGFIPNPSTFGVQQLKSCRIVETAPVRRLLLIPKIIRQSFYFES